MDLRTGLLALAFALFGLGAGVALYQASTDGDAHGFESLQPLAQPQTLLDLSFDSGLDKTVGVEFFGGHWTLLYMGFTSCPDLCPMDMQQLARLYHQLSPAETARLSVLFVSLDPERDSAAKLKGYVAFFDKDFHYLRASNSQLASLVRQFGVFYQRSYLNNDEVIVVPAGADMPQPLPDYYQVEHSSRIFVVDPQGRYFGSFSAPHITKTMMVDIRQLIHR